MHLLSCRSIHLTVENVTPTKDRYCQIHKRSPGQSDVISLDRFTWGSCLRATTVDDLLKSRMIRMAAPASRMLLDDNSFPS